MAHTSHLRVKTDHIDIKRNVALNESFFQVILRPQLDTLSADRHDVGEGVASQQSLQVAEFL